MAELQTVPPDVIRSKRPTARAYDVALLLDTNIAIHLRDLNRPVLERLATIYAPLSLSVLSVAELEGGVHRHPALAQSRRLGLQRVLAGVAVIDCDLAVARVYGDIVAAGGFSRTRVLDRMIAATAIVHDLTLITINGDEFRDIPSLSLEAWPAPGQ